MDFDKEFAEIEERYRKRKEEMNARFDKEREDMLRDWYRMCNRLMLAATVVVVCTIAVGFVVNAVFAHFK